LDVRLALILALAAAVLAGPIGALAASLNVTGTLGAGSNSVAACDTSFGDSYTTVSGNVTAVNVTGIAPECVGGALSVRLTNSAGTSLGSGGPTTVSGTSANVSISGSPDGDLVAGIRISIEGP
jgi:hypothetical protein